MQNDKPLLERSYHIPLAMFDDAFRKFQRKYVVPQNIVFSLILLVIAGIYVKAVLEDPSRTIGYLLIVICLGMMLSRWYKMFKLRRSVHDALKGVEADEYGLRLFETSIEISTKDAPEELPVIAEEMPDEPVAESEPATDENGFQTLFPETNTEQQEIPPTVIEFGSGVKINEFPEYFMIYLVKQNFYVIPKKEFSEDEITRMKKCFFES